MERFRFILILETESLLAREITAVNYVSQSQGKLRVACVLEQLSRKVRVQ
jgi:hypothetical protein